MGNRKQPFGYRMEMGRVVIHLQEAEIVQYVFQQYIAGASFSALVNSLSAQDISYDQDKAWNKNMVARILADQRYTGENEYPAIISQADLETAMRIRTSRQVPIQKTAAQKVIRQLSIFPALRSGLPQRTLSACRGLPPIPGSPLYLHPPPYDPGGKGQRGRGDVCPRRAGPASAPRCSAAPSVQERSC